MKYLTFSRKTFPYLHYGLKIVAIFSILTCHMEFMTWLTSNTFLYGEPYWKKNSINLEWSFLDTVYYILDTPQCCGPNLQIPLGESIKNQSNFGDLFFFSFWQYLKTFLVQLSWSIISSWFCWYCLGMPVSKIENTLTCTWKKHVRKWK